jgi:hypothetical protein
MMEVKVKGGEIDRAGGRVEDERRELANLLVSVLQCADPRFGSVLPALITRSPLVDN